MKTSLRKTLLPSSGLRRLDGVSLENGSRMIFNTRWKQQGWEKRIFHFILSSVAVTCNLEI